MHSLFSPLECMMSWQGVRRRVKRAGMIVWGWVIITIAFPLEIMSQAVSLFHWCSLLDIVNYMAHTHWSQDSGTAHCKMSEQVCVCVCVCVCVWGVCVYVCAWCVCVQKCFERLISSLYTFQTLFRSHIIRSAQCDESQSHHVYNSPWVGW